MALQMRRTLETRPHWQIALLLTIVMRVVYSGAAAVFSLFLHPDPRLVRSNMFTGSLPPTSGVHYVWLDIWQRFDTLWYLHIAAQGYDRPAAVTFYPVYPLLMLAHHGVKAFKILALSGTLSCRYGHAQFHLVTRYRRTTGFQVYLHRKYI